MALTIGTAVLSSVGSGSLAGVGLLGTSVTFGTVVGEVTLAGALIGVQSLADAPDQTPRTIVRRAS